MKVLGFIQFWIQIAGTLKFGFTEWHSLWNIFPISARKHSSQLEMYFLKQNVWYIQEQYSGIFKSNAWYNVRFYCFFCICLKLEA